MAQPAFVDFYRTLQIKPTATAEQIRSAYIDLAKRQHPDKGGSLRAMRRLNQAYETLHDPARRTSYDAMYREHKLDVRNGLADDWDIDDVDNFLREVYLEERRQAWFSPLLVGLSVVGVTLLLFVILAVGHMLTSSGVSPAVPVQLSRDGHK